MEFEAYSNLTNIQAFFYGQNVFLTGASGLVGKVVLEKLLRCCPGIGTVYIIMRPKKGLSSQQRLEKMLNVELFRDVKTVFPLFRKKIQLIEGDISAKFLGMSFEEYEKICQTVTIVIHSAASVNFNDPLKVAMDHNVKSTQSVLELCHKIKNLKAFVHVSTAFVKREADRTVLEQVPKPKIRPDRLLDAMEWMDKKSEDAVSDLVTEKYLTTYLVTKALAESLIEDMKGDLPIAIVRPAYISPTYKDPFPGWIDNIQGLSGLLLAGAKGVLRTLKSVKGLKINVIPVDFVANSIIASAWHVGITKPENVFVVNTVIDYDNLANADEEILEFTLKKRGEYPLVNMFRYPHFSVYYNEFAYQIHALIDQWIPALFIDFFLFIFTGKTILFKVYSKISFLYNIFYKFGKDPWLCKHDNYDLVRDRMSEEDDKIFFMNSDNFDWPTYIDECLKGGRKYLAKEDPSNIPYAKKKAFIWWLVTTVLKWFLILYFLHYLFTRSFFTPIYDNIQDKVYKLYS